MTEPTSRQRREDKPEARRPLHHVVCRGVLVATLALSGLPSGAQTAVEFGEGDTTSDQPVEVTADQLEVDRDAGTALFSGDVLVVQGALRLRGDRVDVLYGPGPDGESRVERVEALGNVVLVNGADMAEGERALYTVASGQVVMTGDVLLSQGANAMTGEVLTVNVDDSTGVMEGRVRVLFLPEDDADSDAEGAGQ